MPHPDMLPIAVVDVETTGLSPWRHDRIVEIAVVLLGADGDIQEEYETLVNPGRDIGPTSIHGITASDVIDAPRFADVAGDVIALLRRAHVLAGHNVSFDRNFLIGEFERLSAPFPELPLLCTCRHFGRQNLAACCAELGITFDDCDFHSALFDARATAKLVAHMLREDPDLVGPCSHPIAWPDFPVGCTRPMPRRQSRRQQLSQPRFLERLVARNVHDTEASSPNVLTYLSLLDRVLEDRIVASHEEDALLSAIERLGLTSGQVIGAHGTYLRHLTALAVADGVVTERERSDLVTVARLLGIDTIEVDDLLKQTQQQVHRLNGALVMARDVRGKRVCFTGELQARLDGEPIERALAHEIATKAGMIVSNSVTKKLDLLVTADPNTQSGKARKARDYGVRIVAEAAFWDMLGVAVG